MVAVRCVTMTQRTFDSHEPKPKPLPSSASPRATASPRAAGGAASRTEWRWGAAALCLVALLSGCGDELDTTAPEGAGSGSGEGGSSAAVGGSGPTVATASGAGGAPTGSGGSGGSGGAGAQAPEGLAEVGSLVVLGDSIGDGGGQGPYYYNLLRDALGAHYGPIEYRNRAQSGSKTGALLGQIQGLPAALPGPVVVAITSGGNDMKDNLLPILAGLDGPLRTQMGANIDAALDALEAPGRFGAGVEVFVFYATIYDASDGQGNFGSSGCNVELDSPSSTDPFFESWNGEIGARVVDHGAALVDMHGHFYGHGFNHPPSWYAGDCTHPNTAGHAELSSLFFGLITGT